MRYKRIDVIPTVVVSGSVQRFNPRSDKYCRKSARLSEQVSQSRILRDEARITLHTAHFLKRENILKM